jgi:hypothetical protein
MSSACLSGITADRTAFLEHDDGVHDLESTGDMPCEHAPTEVVVHSVRRNPDARRKHYAAHFSRDTPTLTTREAFAAPIPVSAV